MLKHLCDFLLEQSTRKRAKKKNERSPTAAAARRRTWLGLSDPSLNVFSDSFWRKGHNKGMIFMLRCSWTLHEHTLMVPCIAESGTSHPKKDLQSQEQRSLYVWRDASLKLRSKKHEHFTHIAAPVRAAPRALRKSKPRTYYL